jgi:hypothetical protein
MSEDQTKIQSTPAVPAGAQRPLISDAMRQTHGFVGNQDTMSISRGPNVDAGSNPIAGGAKNDLNRGATVQGRQQENAKPVDARNIGEGSYKGDTRNKPGDTAKASLFEAAVGAGGPRQPSGQFPNGKRDAKLGSFSGDHSDQSFPTVDDGD